MMDMVFKNLVGCSESGGRMGASESGIVGLTCHSRGG